MGGVVVPYDIVLGLGQSNPSFGIGPAANEVWRAFLYFDTTSLPTGLSIQKAVVTLYISNLWADTDFNITVQNGQPTCPHDPTQTADFDKAKYSGIGGQLSTVGLTEGFNDVVLNSAGIGWINSGGWTKLCLRSDRDIDGIPPTNAEHIGILASEYDNGSYRARLNIYVQAVPPTSPLSASISPLSASILAGQSVTFTSTVSGGYAPYSYQWYLNDNPLSGATSNSWTYTPSNTGIHYVYLKVTDADNNTAQSETARVMITSTPVGGYSVSFDKQTLVKPLTLNFALVAGLALFLAAFKRKTKKERN